MGEPMPGPWEALPATVAYRRPWRRAEARGPLGKGRPVGLRASRGESREPARGLAHQSEGHHHPGIAIVQCLASRIVSPRGSEIALTTSGGNRKHAVCRAGGGVAPCHQRKDSSSRKRPQPDDRPSRSAVLGPVDLSDRRRCLALLAEWPRSVLCVGHTDLPGGASSVHVICKRLRANAAPGGPKGRATRLILT
jgi:hypothetical protein